MRRPSTRISMRRPMPIQPTFRKLPPTLAPLKCAGVRLGKNSPPSTRTASPAETMMRYSELRVWTCRVVMAGRSLRCTPCVVATAAVNPAKVAVREIDVDSSIDAATRRPFYARFVPSLTQPIPEITGRPKERALLRALRFWHQRHDGVPLEREILLEGVVDVLLRERVGSLESQRDAACVSPQQVDRLQRVQPIAVLKKGVLQAVPLLLFHRLHVRSGGTFLLQPFNLGHHSRGQALHVLRRAAELHAGRPVPRLWRRVRVAHAHRVRAAQLLAENVSQPHL